MPHSGRKVRGLRRGTLALDRQQNAVAGQQREAPSHQTVQWRYCPRGDPGSLAHRLPDELVLGASAHHPHPIGQAQHIDCLSEEIGAPLQALDEVHRQIWPPDRHRQAGQTGPAADIDDPRTEGEKICDDRAIEQMAVPDSVSLAWTDEPALHPRRRQQPRVMLGDGKLVAEHRRT